MSGLIGGRKEKRSEWDQETAFLVDCGTSPTERDSVDWPWTGEEATTQGWVGEGVRGCYESRQSVTSAPLRGQLDGNWHSDSDAGFRMGEVMTLRLCFGSTPPSRLD